MTDNAQPTTEAGRRVAALRDIRSALVYAVGFEHGRANHRQDPNTCDVPLCATERKLTEALTALIDADTPAEPHRYDHDGTHRHHHHDQTADPVWWLNCDQFGGERREHRHDANDTLDRLRSTIEAEVRDRTALLDTRLADLRRAALAVYHGQVGFDNPKDPDILALGAVLFPDRACGEVVRPFRASCVLPRGHDGDHEPTHPVAPEPRSAEPECLCEGEFPAYCGPECRCHHHEPTKGEPR